MAANGPLTGTALSLLPDALPMMATNPPPAHPGGKLNRPASDEEEAVAGKANVDQAAAEKANVERAVEKVNIALTAHPDTKLNSPASNMEKAADEKVNVRWAIEKAK